MMPFKQTFEHLAAVVSSTTFVPYAVKRLHKSYTIFLSELNIDTFKKKKNAMLNIFLKLTF